MMQRLPFVLVFILFAFQALSAPLSITGTLSDVENIDQIVLFEIYGDQTFPVDSTTIDSSGSFQFGSDLNLHPGFYMIQLNENSAIDVLLNKEPLVFQTSALNPSATMEVESSWETRELYKVIAERNQISQKKQMINQLLQLYQQDSVSIELMNSLENELNHLEARIFAIDGEYEKQHPDRMLTRFLIYNDYIPDFNSNEQFHGKYTDQQTFLKDYFFYNFDLQDSLLLYSRIIPNKYETYLGLWEANQTQYTLAIQRILDMVKVNHELYQFTVEFFLRALKNSEFNDLFAYLSDLYEAEFAQGCEVDRLGFDPTKIKALKENLAVGKPAPLFDYVNIQGEEKSLEKLDARATLLVFWSSWCGHCKEAMPELKAMYEKYDDKGLEIVGISLDQQSDQAKAFINELALPWDNTIDPSLSKVNISEMYNITHTPTLYLLNKNKHIVAKPKTVLSVEKSLDFLVTARQSE
jgi:peroxiredoxin